MKESSYTYNNGNRRRNGRYGSGYNDYDDRWEAAAGNRRRAYSKDEGLIIEDNTIYEIDLDCYECLREQKKRVLAR